MENELGFTHEGLQAALRIKEDYKAKRPILMPGSKDTLLVPETVMDHNIDLISFEDPLPLAMMASRDPEAPMALAAATRLSPLGGRTKILSGVVEIIGETSNHEAVKECMEYIQDRHFEPSAIVEIRRQASNFIVRSRRQYTTILRENLKALLEGDIVPRQFVREFFELTEAGNMRNDIRKKLVLSLLLSSTVRPSVKFLMLENFSRMARPVQLGIISGVVQAEPSKHLEIIKEELRYLVLDEPSCQLVH